MQVYGRKVPIILMGYGFRASVFLITYWFDLYYFEIYEFVNNYQPDKRWSSRSGISEMGSHFIQSKEMAIRANGYLNGQTIVSFMLPMRKSRCYKPIKQDSMRSRFVSIWFPYLLTDAHCCDRPALKGIPLAVAAPERGRMKIKGVNDTARQKGIGTGMVLADCRAIFPGLEAIPYKEGIEKQLLNDLALWCIRYAPVTAVDRSV